MAHSSSHHNESHSKRIWFVFIILSIVTLVEVVLGIFKPDILVDYTFLSMKWLNWIFIILTIYKAYLIAWAFMHLESESKGLRRSIVWTAVFLISYILFILLIEGDYVYEVYRTNKIAWDF